MGLVCTGPSCVHLRKGLSGTSCEATPAEPHHHCHTSSSPGRSLAQRPFSEQHLGICGQGCHACCKVFACGLAAALLMTCKSRVNKSSPLGHGTLLGQLAGARQLQ